MGEGLFQKRLGAWRPVDDKALEDFNKVKEFEVCRNAWKRVRNPRQFALYWALVGLLHQHQKRYATKEQLSDAIKIGMGLYDEFQLRDGRTAVHARSIAFGNMPQDEWEDFFSKVLLWVTENLLPGVSDAELREQIESMVRGREEYHA